ncbi:acyl-CoA dehydrogenase family protein [Rhodococcus sp. NPDC003382]|uniref:acyl-CoA dehydrogenase family protein n=1 Tax=Rhodococcus sp. HM1 TaxID=2937759 RepID=UPI00200B5F3D|nr:acyl-CoA dehydrogenase family protein [Rhodococcus sp. HM1]MCK8669807.1 acyl-CoA/acyl-ACP dehydrogenase [Rhodococcus sp. HM1]
MDFALSDEQEALAEAERAWLTKNDPIAARRPGIDDGPARITPTGVRHLAESGLIGLLTTDMGGTHVDLAVLVEEHGRAGSALPVAELAVAARLLEQLDHPAFGATESGIEIVVPALASIENPALHAQLEGDALRLSGTTAPATGLIDAHSVLIVATTDSGAEVAAVLPIDTVSVRTLENLDLTRSWSVADVDATLDAGAWSALPSGTAAYLHDALATFRAMDALGAAARLVDLTVEYAGQRTQFDRPIASFQAVKHHCANMALSVEASRAALWAAAVALDGYDADTRTRAVSAAAAFTGEGASTTAQTALQVHGGIGFTWEHDVHLLIRRIKVDELLDGSVSYHRRRLVTA